MKSLLVFSALVVFTFSSAVAQGSLRQTGPKAKNTPAWQKKNLSKGIYSQKDALALKGPQYKNRTTRGEERSKVLIPVVSPRNARLVGPVAKNMVISPKRFKVLPTSIMVNHDIDSGQEPVKKAPAKEKQITDEVISESER